MNNQSNTSESLTQLLEVCSQAEAAELKILHNAQIQCLKAYKQEPTYQKKRDWDAAKSGFEERMGQLWSIYMDPSGSEVLKNRREAHKYLQEQGYKIGHSKLYKDAAAGRLQVRDDGSVLVSELYRYVKKLGLEPLSSSTSPDQQLEQLHETKLKKEVEKLEWENKKREFEYEKELGRWIPREDLELELASRAAVLDSGLRTKMKTLARDVVFDLGGTPDRVPEVVGKINEALDTAMNEFARMDRFQVVFESDEESDASGQSAD